jgi:hypothetical protein
MSSENGGWRMEDGAPCAVPGFHPPFAILHPRDSGRSR